MERLTPEEILAIRDLWMLEGVSFNDRNEQTLGYAQRLLDAQLAKLPAIPEIVFDIDGLVPDQYYWVKSVADDHHWDFITEFRLYQCRRTVEGVKSLLPDRDVTRIIWCHPTNDYFSGKLIAVPVLSPTETQLLLNKLKTPVTP